MVHPDHATHGSANAPHELFHCHDPLSVQVLLDSESHAAKVNDFFDIALPVGGIICTPFIGLLLDNLNVQLTLAVIVSLATVIGVLNSLPFVWAAYTTVCLFVLLRPLYYSAMS